MPYNSEDANPNAVHHVLLIRGGNFVNKERREMEAVGASYSPLIGNAIPGVGWGADVRPSGPESISSSPFGDGGCGWGEEHRVALGALTALLRSNC